MGTLVVQNDFTHGEMEPRLIGRSDIVLYKKAARQMRNVLVLPGGGAKRRFGTEFIADITDSSTQFKLNDFEFSEEVAYLLLFTSATLRIYLNGELKATLVTPYPDSVINSLKFAQTTNRLVITHPDFIPHFLSRGGDDVTWNLSPFDFTFVPFHDFIQGTYDNNTFKLSGTSKGAETLTVSGAGPFLFTDAYVGGAFFASGADVTQPLGYARITNKVSSTVVDVEVVVEFEKSAYSGKDCDVLEKAWSDLEPDGSGNRGWPISCTFYQDRLYFGGSRSLPQTIFASQVDDFVDFDIGTGEDDQAIIETLGSNKINDIKHIVSDRSLQLFTFSSEWSAPQIEDSPLTPSNISIQRQTGKGATNVDPVILDNFTFYVKRGGKGVMAYDFNFDSQSYNSKNVSIISSNLIRQPLDSCVLRGSFLDDADYLFLINNDGTMANFQSLAEQDVSAWTLSETQGKFLRCQEVGDDIFFIVERTANNLPVRYIERLNFDFFMDSQKTQTFGSPTSSITGLEHLNGKIVKVRGDGFVQPDKMVINGEITIDEAATVVEVGLGFNPLIEVLPVIIQSQQGPTNYIPKRINRIWAQFHETLGVYVNGEQLIPNLQLNDVFDENTLQPSAEPQTGSFQLYNQGWYISPGGRASEREPKTITITQEDPLPMNILSVGYEVTI
jgi:hypothetical protein